MAKYCKVFENEAKIWKMGGKIEGDYLTFRELVISLNNDIIPLFALLGFTLADRDKLIEILLDKAPMSALSEEYCKRMNEKIESGKIKLEDILPNITLKKLAEIDEPPEKKERRKKNGIRRSVLARYEKIKELFEKKYNPSELRYNRRVIQIFQGALNLAPNGLVIDVDKYINIYSDYLESIGSTTFEEHQRVADTINRFFGGAVPITQEELKKYFVLDCGKVIPNSEAINREHYLRLGYKPKENKRKK